MRRTDNRRAFGLSGPRGAELHCEYLTDHLQGQWHIQQCGQTLGVEVHKDERSTRWVVGDGYVARVRQVEVI